MSDLDLFRPEPRGQTAIERAVLQEAYLAESLLCGGMTSIRRLSYNDPGRAFEAFFGLSNGVERIAKLILVSDHYARTSQFPDTGMLKSYGHDLRRLLERVEEVASERQVELEDAPSENTGSEAVVDFLTKFARTDRYYNINRMVQGDGDFIDDPVSRWVDLVKSHAPEKRRRMPSEKEQEHLALARHLDASGLPILTNFNALSGDSLGNLERVVAQNYEDAWIGVEGMLLALRPLRFLTKTIWRLNNARQPLPYYSEIFVHWAQPDSQLRSRRGFPRGRN
ncbi:hypothetical protein [Cryobacterium sp. PH31-L1]|uniref:hypothetical protein n=1 Tax=Cryobacterium sp. PH31-L1 TaxID=3046199 RepID=UPI0024B894FA|nr:hypothetical protein [Cryobacterium sp. PH31-L1]MDJ0379143.1 hypothetical protein [Cryobacterium sp. PH31-L1]